MTHAISAKVKGLIGLLYCAEVEEKFGKSAWGKKLESRRKKAALTDFERYKAAVTKTKKSKAARTSFNKLKKQQQKA